MSTVLDAPAPELLPITPTPSLKCESCELHQATMLVTLPRNELDELEGAGRPGFVVCLPCAEVVQ